MTATNSGAGSGSLTTYPTGTAKPSTSSLDYIPSAAITAGGVVSQLGTGNAVTIANSTTGATVRVVVDLLGYYTDGTQAVAGDTYVPLSTPARIVNSQSIAAGGTVIESPLGAGGVPAANVAAVVVNLTARSTVGGVLTAYPDGTTRPGTADLNFHSDNWPYSNQVPLLLGADGQFDVRSSSTAATTLDIDVIGYFQTPAGTALGSAFVPLQPSRAVSSQPISAGGSFTYAATGTAGVPSSGVAAVSFRAAAASATAPGNLVVYPTGSALPTIGGPYFRPSEIDGSFQNSALGTNGSVTMHDSTASAANLTIDVFGFYRAPSVPGAPTSVTATATNPSSVSWSAPTSDGGSPITGYTVSATATVNGSPQTVTSQTTSTSATLPLLPRGRTFSISVVATNAIGSSAAGTTSLNLPFIHPGILLDRNQLDFTAGNLTAQPWATALTNMRFHSNTTNPNHPVQAYAGTSYTPHPVTTVTCSGASTDACSFDLGEDGAAAYAQALMYYYPGDSSAATHEANALSIIHAWASTLTAFDSSAQSRLVASWAGQLYPRAAEIIRAKETNATTINGLNSDIVSLSQRLLPELTGSPADSVFAASGGNWDLARTDALIDIGVYRDDPATFDSGVATWQGRVPSYIYLSSDGSTPIPPPGGLYSGAALRCMWLGQPASGQPSPGWTNCTVNSGAAYMSGQIQETCRDSDHAMLGIENMTNAATTAGIQGVDLFGEQQARVIAGYEFYAKYVEQALAGAALPGSLCGDDPTVSGTQGTMHLCPLGQTSCDGHLLGLEVAYTHFAELGGSAMPCTTRYLANRTRPYTHQYGHALDWETLTFARSSLPTPLPTCP